jgi:hypothetical protein
MPTPSKGYYAKDGKRVPGTTTIIGRFKESGALIRWAYNRGKEGLELYESRDKAAEIGTIVHSMVEEYIKLNDPMEIIAGNLSITEDDEKAIMSSFSSFCEWFESNKFRVVSQEEQLVSEMHRYGGTPDAIAWDIKDRLCLLDWKTSDSVYSDHLYQLGAYRILWNETHPDTPLTGGSHLCRFAKTHGDFAHHFFPDLGVEERGFLIMRELYDIDQVTKKRV